MRSSWVRTAIALTVLSGILAGCAGGGRSLPAARATSADAGSALFSQPPRLPATASVPRRPSFVDAAPPAAPKTMSAGRTTLAAHPSFFTGENALSNGVYYLQLPNTNVFGYYSYLPDPHYIYHFDLGYVYVVDANDGKDGIYLYDFAGGHWWYTSPSFPFPYLYDFTLQAFIYYYPDTQRPQHYTTNPRFFYDFGTSQIITIPGGPSKTTLRSDAQAALAAAKVVDTGGYYLGGAPLGAMSVVRSIRSRRFAQSYCNTITLGSNSYTSTTDANGITTETYTDFYDAHCMQTERVAVMVYPKGSSYSSGTATGSTTEYDKAGAVIGYATSSSTFNASTMTVQTADAKTVGGAVVGRSGVTCQGTSCGLASFATVGGVTTGVAETVYAAFTPAGSFNSNATETLAATTYSGAGLTLVAPSSGIAWGLAGGSQIDSLSGNGSGAYNGSFVTSASYSLTDSTTPALSASASIPSGSLETLTITLVQSGTTWATVVVDDDGNGTITYAADGSKETVAGFTIFG